MKTPKLITADVALQARGLFALGNLHYRKLRDVERALHDLLGYDDDDPADIECLGDELYNEESGSFDRGIKKDGFMVKSSKSRAVKQRAPR